MHSRVRPEGHAIFSTQTANTEALRRQLEHFGLEDLNNGRSPSSSVLQSNDAGREPDPSQEKSAPPTPTPATSQELTGAATTAGGEAVPLIT